MITHTPIVFDVFADNRCRLLYDVTYKAGEYTVCHVPAGFISDGFSRRWWMPLKWSRWREKYRSAALLHDYMLHRRHVPKWEADWWFHGALRSNNVSALESGLFWLAVRTRR